MTLETIQSYGNVGQLFMGLLQLSGMDNFVSEFQTFAPLISTEIATYYNDGYDIAQSKIFFYTELYKDSCSEFLFNYATENNIEPLVESLMVTELPYNVNLSGKVAKVKISEWFTFAAKVVNTSHNGFSTSLSGNDVLVFFL